MFWPVQTMLLVLCPDVIKRLKQKQVLDDVKMAEALLDRLQQSLGSGNSQVTEVAILSYIDIVRASAYGSNDNVSVLRQLVPQLEDGLRSALFNPQRPYCDAEGNTNARLMKDCLVAYFRYNHDKCLTSLIPLCTDDASPAAFKMAVVRMLVSVAEETPMLSWIPTIKVTYEDLGGWLRATFCRVVSRVRQHDAARRGAGGGRLPKVAAKRDEASIDAELLRCLVRLFCMDPYTALTNKSKAATDVLNDTRLLLTSLMASIQDSQDARYVHDAIRALLRMHSPEYIPLWNPLDPLRSFWEISDHIIFSLAILLVGNKPTNLIQLLEWLRQLLIARAEFIEQNKTAAALQYQSSIRSKTASMLEVAVLTHLLAPDMQIVSLTAAVIGELCREVEGVRHYLESGAASDPGRGAATGDADAASSTACDSTPKSRAGAAGAGAGDADADVLTTGRRYRIPNLDVYQQLALSGLRMTGRAAQQKRIRQLLMRMTECTIGSEQAWTEIFLRWQSISSKLVGTGQRVSATDTEAERSALLISSIIGSDNISDTAISTALSAAVFGAGAPATAAATGAKWKPTILPRLNTGMSKRAPAGDRPDDAIGIKVTDATLQEWAHMTGFLCVLGGVCMLQETSERVPGFLCVPLTDPAANPAPVAGGTAAASAVAGHSDRPIGAGPTVSSKDRRVAHCISDLLDLLACSRPDVGAFVRESTTEMVGNELHPLLYPMLFDGIQARMDGIRAGTSKFVTPETVAVFVNQSMAIVRGVLHGRSDLPEIALERLGCFNIEPLLMSFMHFVQSLGSTAVAMRLRMRFCQLIEIVMQRREWLAFSHEMLFRNAMVNYLSDWLWVLAIRPGAAASANPPGSPTHTRVSLGGAVTAAGGAGGVTVQSTTAPAPASGMVTTGSSAAAGAAAAVGAGTACTAATTAATSTTAIAPASTATAATTAAPAAACNPAPVHSVSSATVRPFGSLPIKPTPGLRPGAAAAPSSSPPGAGAASISAVGNGGATATATVTTAATAIATTAAAATGAAAGAFATAAATSAASAPAAGPATVGAPAVRGSAIGGAGGGLSGTGTPLMAGGAENTVNKLDVDSLVRMDPGVAKLVQALNLACMRAITALLQGMPVQPNDEDVAESEALQAKARVFSKHFHFLMSVMDRCHALEGTSETANLPNLVSGDAMAGTVASSTAAAAAAAAVGLAAGSVAGTNGGVLEQWQSHLAQLHERAIEAMSALLNANIDCGLGPSIRMAYHRDPRARAAFVLVLTNILKQGTEFDMLSETAMSERYHRLVALLTDDAPEHSVAVALCQAVPAVSFNGVVSVLCRIFDARKQLLSLLCALISSELRASDTLATIFRRNSAATRMITHIFFRVGSAYLHAALDAPLQHMLALNAASFEVNPTLLAADEDLSKNRARLVKSAQQFLDSICAAADQWPPFLQAICHHLSVSARGRFPSAPQASHRAVAGVVFLRFITPAIVAPAEFGLLAADTQPSVSVRRGLTLISKMLQNLANAVPFSKEPYMLALNAWLQKNTAAGERFLSDISRTPDAAIPMSLSLSAATGSGSDDSDGGTTEGDEARTCIMESDLLALHAFLHSNMDRIGRILMAKRAMLTAAADSRVRMPPIRIGEPDAAVSTLNEGAHRQRPYDRLTMLLAQLGSPPDRAFLYARRAGADADAGGVAGSASAGAARCSTNFGVGIGGGAGGSGVSAADGGRGIGQYRSPGPSEEGESWIRARSGSTSAYDELMERMGGRNVDFVRAKRVFYAAGESRQHRSVLYYIVRMYETDSIGQDLLHFHILNTYKAYLGKPYDLLIDCTFASAKNDIREEWIARFVELAPDGMLTHLAQIYVLHGADWLKHMCKRFQHYLVGAKLVDRAVFVDSIQRLGQYITPEEQRLPARTKAIENAKEFRGILLLPSGRLGDGAGASSGAARGTGSTAASATAAVGVSFMSRSNAVVVRIGVDAVAIVSPNRRLLGRPVTLTNVYSVGDLFDVSLTADSSIVALHCVASVSGSSVLRLQSPEHAAELATTIQHMIARYRLSHAAPLVGAPTDGQAMRPADVPGIMLNMALLNMGSSDASLRVSAYNLLHAISVAFNFDIGGQLVESVGLCIPTNSTDFLLRISSKLAATESRLTLEFLHECVFGFSQLPLDLKRQSLKYMAPWLPNLARCCGLDGETNAEQVAKATRILRQLILLTCTEEQLFSELQTTVWRTIAADGQCLERALDLMVTEACAAGLGSSQCETLASTMVTLASTNISKVGWPLVRRLLDLIIKGTSCNPVSSVDKHPTWCEIVVLLRFILMLSFNNLLNVMRTLPALLHIITMVLATGSLLVRASVMCMTMNTVQSLATSLELSGEQLRTFRVLLTDASLRLRYLFGLERYSGSLSQAAYTLAFAHEGQTFEPLSLQSVETVASALMDIVDSCPSTEDMSPSTCVSRWMVLAMRQAFSWNPALQPRAFVVLGCVTPSCDDALLVRVLRVLLQTLSGALSLRTMEADMRELTRSILMCLGRLHLVVGEDARGLRHLFWIAVALVQLADADILPSALTLLDVNLHTLDQQGAFGHASMHQVLLEAREEGGYEDICTGIDGATGLSFRKSFSFAVAGSLTRARERERNQDSILQVLQSFLEVDSGFSCDSEVHLSTSALGYATALVALQGDCARPLPFEASQILSKDARTGDHADTLLLALMLQVLGSSDEVAERLYVYRFLERAVSVIPRAFAILYGRAGPRCTRSEYGGAATDTAACGSFSLLSECLQRDLSAASPELVDVVLRLVRSLVTNNVSSGTLPSAKAPSMQKAPRELRSSFDHLHAIGFAGMCISASGTSTVAQKGGGIEQCCKLIEQVIAHLSASAA